MKKWICLVLVVSLTISLTSSLFADESYLIDFSKLKANSVDGKTTEEGGVAAPLAADSEEYLKYDDHTSTVNGVEMPRTQHIPTLLDYSGVVGSNFSEEDKKGLRVSLAPSNWEVELNSSAATVENQAYSYCKELHTKANDVLYDAVQTADGGQPAAKPEGYTILGVRIKFPEHAYNSWGLIKPPYEIPAYESITTDFVGNPVDGNLPENRGIKYENGYGVIKNVGTIKNIKMRIYGLQFKNSVSIILKDDNFKETEYHFPQYLDFEGWKEIAWVNPNYIDKVANRDLYIIPLYPRNEPHVKLQGFRVYRQGDQVGGDFVTYIKDVKITYDNAILKTEKEIDHEGAWEILEDRTQAAKQRALLRIGDSQLLQFIENRKMHKEESSQ